MSTILQELVAIENSCAEVFNRGDVDAILNHFSDRIAGFSSTRYHMFKGKEELRKTFAYYLSEADEVSYQIQDADVLDLGDTAILNFYWKVTLKSGDHRTEIPGRGSHVFHKEDGQWKIVHEHFSRAH